MVLTAAVPALAVLVPVALLAAGLGLLWGAARTAAARRRDDAAAATADALVVRLEHRTVRTGPGNRAQLLFPVLRFRLPDGREVEHESRTGAAPAPAREGDVVPVRFDPADPAGVRLASAGAGRLPSLVLAVVGAGLVAVAGLSLLVLLALG